MVREGEGLGAVAGEEVPLTPTSLVDEDKEAIEEAWRTNGERGRKGGRGI